MTQSGMTTSGMTPEPGMTHPDVHPSASPLQMRRSPTCAAASRRPPGPNRRPSAIRCRAYRSPRCGNSPAIGRLSTIGARSTTKRCSSSRFCHLAHVVIRQPDPSRRAPRCALRDVHAGRPWDWRHHHPADCAHGIRPTGCGLACACSWRHTT